MSSNMQVAKTILEQFGGNSSLYMIGAKNLVSVSDGEGGLSFKHMKTQVNGKPANYFKIVLNEKDLYDLEFGWIHSLNYTARETINDVYAEDLKHIFENTTKLYLTL